MSNYDNFIENIKPKDNLFEKKSSNMSFKGKNPNVLWHTMLKSHVTNHPKFIPIKDPILKYDDSLTENDLPRVRQDEEAWREMRTFKESNNSKLYEKFIVGASALSTLLCLTHPDQLKEFKLKWGVTIKSFKNDFYDKLNGIQKNFKPSEDLRLQYGKKHEILGVAAFLKKYKDSTVTESGSYFLPTDEDCKYHYVCSPDGFYTRDVDGEEEDGCLEIKTLCPFINVKDGYQYVSKNPWDVVPHYYIAQGQFQCAAAGKKRVCYVCITPTKGVAFYYVEFNQKYYDLCNKAIKYVFDKYKGAEKKDIPDHPLKGFKYHSKLIEMTKKLQEKSGKTKEFLEKEAMDPFYLKGEQYAMFYGPPIIDEPEEKEEVEEKPKRKRKKQLEEDENPKKKRAKVKKVEPDIIVIE